MKGDKTKPCVIYLVTNSVNGKRYIGVTTHPLRLRMKQHKSGAMRKAHNGMFYRAIRKYGFDKFSAVVIHQCATAYEGLKEEIRLIAEMKPEYNSTLGGESALAINLTLEGRQRIIDANKGNKYMLGKKHSEEVITLLRELGLAQKEQWLKRSHLGPQSRQRKVECVDDGKIYESIKDAALAYGVARSALNELCLGQRYRKTVGGLRFRFSLQPEARIENVVASAS